MNEINKLNPLLEAMNDIDDAIVTEAAPAKRRPKYFKPLMIAAAAAVLCGATAVTAAANIKMNDEVTLDGKEPAEIIYDVYTDEDGWEISTYMFPLPEYCLLDEEEGCTPVGKIRAYRVGEHDWEFVDEEGNTFPNGVNNMAVEVTFSKKGPGGGSGVTGCGTANFNDLEYWTETHHNGTDNTLRVQVNRHSDEEIQRTREFLEEHGITDYRARYWYW